MIIDQITNSHLYYTLHPQIRLAFEYLQHTDLYSLRVGKNEIDGQNLYAMVQQYTTKPKEQGAWEAHRRYMDLHVVMQGIENIGYAYSSRLTQGEYDANKDFIRLFGAGDFLNLYYGNFALFMPEEAHMPGIAIDSPAPVKKIVVKIRIETNI
jgi:YhcH/YjgK/YiaL family protein